MVFCKVQLLSHCRPLRVALTYYRNHVRGSFFFHTDVATKICTCSVKSSFDRPMGIEFHLQLDSRPSAGSTSAGYQTRCCCSTPKIFSFQSPPSYRSLVQRTCLQTAAKHSKIVVTLIK